MADAVLLSELYEIKLYELLYIHMSFGTRFNGRLEGIQKPKKSSDIEFPSDFVNFMTSRIRWKLSIFKNHKCGSMKLSNTQ